MSSDRSGKRTGNTMRSRITIDGITIQKKLGKATSLNGDSGKRVRKAISSPEKSGVRSSISSTTTGRERLRSIPIIVRIRPILLM